MPIHPPPTRIFPNRKSKARSANMVQQTSTKHTTCGHITFPSRKPAKASFFRTLFCIHPRPLPKDPQYLPVRIVRGDCPGCAQKRADMAHVKPTPMTQIGSYTPTATSQRQHHLVAASNSARANRQAARHASDRMAIFRCSACVSEHRYSSPQARAVTSGLCCARGEAEWTAKGYGSPSVALPVHVEETNLPRVIRRKPVPVRCQQPGIDWERWSEATQTRHGRLPPPPTKALPSLPKTKKQRSETNRPAYARPFAVRPGFEISAQEEEESWSMLGEEIDSTMAFWQNTTSADVRRRNDY